MEPHYYKVNLTWTKDRRGYLSSPEIDLLDTNQGQLEVATPPQFPGGITGIWSPEHLYTAAVSSCLMTTFLAIAENMKLDFIEFKCKAKGKLAKVENRFLMSEIILKPTVHILNEEDREKAIRILHKAEAACLISNSITAKVILEPEIRIATTLTSVQD